MLSRETVGLGLAAILVAVALGSGGIGLLEPALLVVAGAVVLATLAPSLPILHRLPRLGASNVWAYVNFGDDSEMVVTRMWGHADDRILRVGFRNEGPRGVRPAYVNVLVPASVNLEPVNGRGEPEARGSYVPDTPVNGQLMHVWSESGVDLHVGNRIFHYRLSFPDADALGDNFPVRVTFSADALYGGERAHERSVKVVDLAAS